MIDSPFGITGLIATILAVIFAIAAMLNSRHRRMAARNAARPKNDDSDEVDDRPYKIADPFTAATFTTPAHVADSQAPAAAPAAPAPVTVTRPAITAFRQLDAHGIEIAPSSTPSDDTYVWE